VSQPERFFIEGLYHRFVAGDPEKAIETFQAWKRVYPGSAIPPNYIAATLSDEMGQYEAAVAEAREAVRLAPNTSWPYNNLAQALTGAGRFAELRTAVAEAASRGLDDRSMHAYLLTVAEFEGDQAAVERETRWGVSNPATVVLWLRLRATEAAERGRLGEARRLWQQALDRAAENGTAADLAAVHLDRAEVEAVTGISGAARRAVEAALAEDTQALSLVRSAIPLALLGDTARARALLDEAARVASTDPAPLRVWLPVVEAFIALHHGRAEDALRILQPVARQERGNDFVMVPLLARGLAALSAGRPADGVTAFEEVRRLRAVSWGPWQVLAQISLARALRESGNAPRSLAAYDAFLQRWKDADRDVPLLTVAQRERAAVAAR
jgi:tetratricopeptide (TPR) repeat protein